jgi:retron-type reverse transcriptase
VKSSGKASDNWCVPAAGDPRDESVAGKREVPESISNAALLAQLLERANLQRALKQVCQNQGAPGIDGMTVDELPGYLRDHWLEIRAQLEAGHYRPANL